jgi:hypothetical protein
MKRLLQLSFVLVALAKTCAAQLSPCSPLPNVGQCSATGATACPSLNGFIPFGPNSAWNTKIAAAPLDPNSAAIVAAGGFTGQHLHHDFGSNFGYPFEVVDSSTQPLLPIALNAYPDQSDDVVAPIPLNAPIEGNPAPGAGCPSTYLSDTHTMTLDRHTCTLYETYNTHRCGTHLTADQETMYYASTDNFPVRPWGWTSADASGNSLYAGLIKYDEVFPACNLNHAIRFTMPFTKGNANNGFFINNSSHAAGTNWGTMNVMGMRIRLKASFKTAGYSAINRCILGAMQNYGMILADNGSYFFFQGAPDPRWNNDDLMHLDAIQSSNFEVLKMTPNYPGHDSKTAPTGPEPSIKSFTASAQRVTLGSQVIFAYVTSGDTYDYIDHAGVVAAHRGSITFRPTATDSYTLVSTNQFGRRRSKPLKVIVVPPSSGGAK